MDTLNKLVGFRFQLVKLALNSKLSKESFQELKRNLILTNELINRYNFEKKIDFIKLTSIEEYILKIKKLLF